MIKSYSILGKLAYLNWGVVLAVKDAAADDALIGRDGEAPPHRF